MGAAEQYMFGETEHGRKPRISRKWKLRTCLWFPWRDEKTGEVNRVEYMSKSWGGGGVFEGGVAENSKEW